MLVYWLFFGKNYLWRVYIDLIPFGNGEFCSLLTTTWQSVKDILWGSWGNSKNIITLRSKCKIILAYFFLTNCICNKNVHHQVFFNFQCISCLLVKLAFLKFIGLCTVTLGYNELYGTINIYSLKPRHYNREALCSKLTIWDNYSALFSL